MEKSDTSKLENFDNVTPLRVDDEYLILEINSLKDYLFCRKGTNWCLLDFAPNVWNTYKDQGYKFIYVRDLKYPDLGIDSDPNYKLMIKVPPKQDISDYSKEICEVATAKKNITKMSVLELSEKFDISPEYISNSLPIVTESEYLIRHSKYFITEIDSLEDAKFYGEGTKWGIVEDEMWNSYKNDGYKFIYIRNLNYPDLGIDSDPNYKLLISVSPNQNVSNYSEEICYIFNAINDSETVNVLKLSEKLHVSPEYISNNIFDITEDAKKEIKEMLLQLRKKNLDNLSIIMESLLSAKHAYVDSNKISEKDFELLLSADPSPKKSYVNWLCKQYVNGYSIEELSPLVSKFYELSRKNRIKKKDIFSYKSVEELKSVLDSFSEEDMLSNMDKVRMKKHSGAKRVYESPDGKILVYQIYTEEASKFYGKNTKWCTSGDKYNTFNPYYTLGMSVYIIINNHYIPQQLEEESIYDKIVVLIEDLRFFQNLYPGYASSLDEFLVLFKRYNIDRAFTVVPGADYLYEPYASNDWNIEPERFAEYAQKWNIPVDSILVPYNNENPTEEEIEKAREEVYEDARRIGLPKVTLDPKPLSYYDKFIVD